MFDRWRAHGGIRVGLLMARGKRSWLVCGRDLHGAVKIMRVCGCLGEGGRRDWIESWSWFIGWVFDEVFDWILKITGYEGFEVSFGVFFFVFFFRELLESLFLFLFWFGFLCLYLLWFGPSFLLLALVFAVEEIKLLFSFFLFDFCFFFEISARILFEISNVFERLIFFCGFFGFSIGRFSLMEVGMLEYFWYFWSVF